MIVMFIVQATGDYLPRLEGWKYISLFLYFIHAFNSMSYYTPVFF